MNKKNKSVSPAPSANLLDEVKETSAYWDEDGTTTIGRATQYAEMGRFQILLLIVCLFAYSNISTFPNILTKASGAIQCDYQLIKEDRKAINDVVYVCMIVGGAAWSLLADTISRKWTLILVLLVYTVSTIAFASANTFLLLGVFRGISAFSRSGIICITITFIAEFQISYFRGSMICCLQLAWIIGMVGIPSLPFAYKSLIIIGTIPAIIAMVGLIFFPDSPRFLLSRGREREAIRSLQMIHAFNTGTTKVNFPIRHLEDNRTAEDIRRNSVVKAFIPEHLEPKFVCIPIVMLAQLALMFSYYTLSLWFPYMVARSEAFFPLARVEDIPQDCKTGLYYKRQDTYVMNPLIYMGGNNLENGTLRIMPFTGQERKQLENPCSQDDRKLFDRRSSTMDALVCMPSLIWLVVKIDTMGRKFFMTFAHVIAGCLAFASYFMHNIGRELLFSCLFDSVTLLSIGVSSCLAVELFSTRVRVLGVALVIGAGQLGTILADIGGAISFGLTCVVVVALIANALANRPTFRHWLCKLHQIEGTPEQMTIRNDYMWFMLLMLQSKRIAEPFKTDPTQGELKPLNQILPMKIYEEILTSSDQNMAWTEQGGQNLDGTEIGNTQEPVTSPPSQFLDNQPLPRDGIICYMAAFSDHDY